MMSFTCHRSQTWRCLHSLNTFCCIFMFKMNKHIRIGLTCTAATRVTLCQVSVQPWLVCVCGGGGVLITENIICLVYNPHKRPPQWPSQECLLRVLCCQLFVYNNIIVYDDDNYLNYWVLYIITYCFFLILEGKFVLAGGFQVAAEISRSLCLEFGQSIKER